MKYLLVLVSLMIGCGTDGSDGSNGKRGIRGEQGDEGTEGSDGSDGTDGTDNRIVMKIFCQAELVGGTMDGAEMTYDVVVFASGDVFAYASLDNLGTWNNTGSAFYSALQVGASSAYVLIHISGTEQLDAQYIASENNVTFRYWNSNTIDTTYSNVDACTVFNF